MKPMGEQLNLALALEGRVKVAPANAQLMAIADALAALPDPEIDRNFMLALEARLLTEGLEEAPARHLQVVKAEPAFPQTPADEIVRRADVIQMPRRRGVVRRSVAAGLAAAMVSAFPLVAAAQSLPGSPFYGLKVRMQHAQIAMFGGAVEDGFSHARLAQQRINEASQLVQIDARQSLIAATLRAANEELEAAKSLILANTTDSATLVKLSGMAAESEADIAAMTGMSGGAKTARDSALNTSQAIQDDIAEALGIETINVAAPQVQAPVSTQTVTNSGLSGGTTYSAPGGDTKSGSSGGGVKTTTKDDPKDPGDGRDPRDLTGPGGGCEIFGADDFGDTFTLVTRTTCEG
jgi:hypothetical protein